MANNAFLSRKNTTLPINLEIKGTDLVTGMETLNKTISNTPWEIFKNFSLNKLSRSHSRNNSDITNASSSSSNMFFEKESETLYEYKNSVQLLNEKEFEKNQTSISEKEKVSNLTHKDVMPLKGGFFLVLNEIYVSSYLKHKLIELMIDTTLIDFLNIKENKLSETCGTNSFDVIENHISLNFNWPNQSNCETQAYSNGHMHVYSVLCELTSSRSINNMFFTNFLNSYHYFINSNDLAKLLLIRYINTYLSEELSLKNKNTQKHRIYNFFKKWISVVPFKMDQVLFSNLKEILRFFALVDEFSEHLINSLIKSLESRYIRSKKYVRTDFDKILSDIDYHGLKSHVSNVRIIEISPRFLVEQLTILEHNVFCQINKTELIKQHKINGNSRRGSCPNLINLSSISNKVSKFVTEEIEKDWAALNTKGFLNITEYMIEASKHCYRINNFNSLFEIVLGINNALQNEEMKSKLLKKVKASSVLDLNKLNDLMSYSRNYKNYRECISESKSKKHIKTFNKLKLKERGSFGDNKSFKFKAESSINDSRKVPNYPPFLLDAESNGSENYVSEISSGSHYGVLPVKPVFPFVGLLLSDLAFTEEGCDNYYRDKSNMPILLNIHKVNLLGKCLSKIFDYQKMKFLNDGSTNNYGFEQHNFIQSWISLNILKAK